MIKKYILALDQGTTGSRAVIFDRFGRIVGIDYKEIKQIYPKPGWVEHDPIDIWETQISVAKSVLKKADIYPKEIAAIGITNQRETTIVWNKKTGKPIYNAIVWQCRRTSDLCKELRNSCFEQYIHTNTGLKLDPYFSSTKIKWILDNVKSSNNLVNRSQLLFGNVDSWLIWNLTGGRIHATDYSNASRTMLYNIKDLKWDQNILKELNIPSNMLPDVKPSSYIYGYTHPELFDGISIPIASNAGDQQAALFGQACFSEGTVKNTYGTGCFMLMNTGNRCIHSKNGLLTTIAWGIDNNVEYALEGSVFIAGAVIQWLRDEMRLIDNVGQSEEIALSIDDTNGVYLVPAFVGLGTPYWDTYARGTIVGLTRGTGKNHIVRAALESIAYQTCDVIRVMEEDSGVKINLLRTDGNAASNNFLMQFQADLLNIVVSRPIIKETTSMGAAFMAGLAVGFWQDKDEISSKWISDKNFLPIMESNIRSSKYNGWKRAVERSLEWENMCINFPS